MEVNSDLSFNGTLRLPITLGQLPPPCEETAPNSWSWWLGFVRRTDRNDGYEEHQPEL